MNKYKVVLMHGFTQEEVSRIMRGVKSVVQEPRDVAFCMSTPSNLEFRVKDLLEEVTTEHEYMLKNPPQKKAEGESD